MFRLTVVDHPYAQAVLTKLRDRSTNQVEFRKGLVRLGRVLGLEIVKDFGVEPVEVETPLGVKARGVKIRDFENVVIITVLRAAWPLTEGLVKIFYAARQGVIAARRVEEKGMKCYEFEVEISYAKIPRIAEDDIVVVSDVMVATGSTMLKVLDEVLRHGRAERYYIAAAIATPISVSRLREYSEKKGIDLRMYVAAVDPEINDRGYIVPGLGDAGDRAFGS